MPRILATWELGIGYGHIANIMPLASHLAARGHEIVLAARDPVTAQAMAGKALASIVQAPIYTRRVHQRETLTYGQVIAEGGFVDVPSVAALVRAWLALFEMIGPDALLIEHAPISLLAAHIAGIAAVRIGPTFTAPPPRDPMPTLMPWAKHRPEELRDAGRLADHIVRDICRMFGAPVIDRLSDLLAGAPAFALTWPELDHHGADPETPYYGPLAGIAATERPEWTKVAGPRALVYLRFDRPAGKTMADALAALGWPAIWHAPQPPSFALAPNIIWSPAPVDLQYVAQSADLFIGRGGHGACGAMLRAGLPQMLLPDTLESLLVTYRLRQAGVALSLSGTAEPQQAVAALQRLVSEQAIRERADRLRAIYAHYDPEAAAEMLANAILAAWNMSENYTDVCSQTIGIQ